MVLLRKLIGSADNVLRRWLSIPALTRIEIGNILIAVSTTGLMALGVIEMSLSLLLLFAFILVILGVIGRYVDSIKDDKERLELYAEHLKKSSARGDFVKDSPSRDSSDGGTKPE